MRKNIFILLLMPLFIACNNTQQDFDATGSFEATEVTVSAEANGRILDLDIEEGSVKQAGVSLGTIDSLQLYLQKQQLLAGMKAVDIRKPDIQKQIAVTEHQMRVAESERLRAIRLVEANAGNQKVVDDCTNQLELLEKQLQAQLSTLSKGSTSTNAEINALQYQIMQIDNQLQKCKITNPRTGTILAKYAEAGETVAFGKPLYKIADLEIMYLRAYLTTEQVNALKLGQKVKVRSDIGKNYEGKITWISNKSEFTPKGVLTPNERANQVYATKIAVKNDGSIKIGQYGELFLNP